MEIALHTAVGAVIAASVSWAAVFIGGGLPQESALIAAAVVACTGALLRIVAIETVGRGFSWGSAAPDTLITHGVYRVMKHPLIAGYVLEVLALALAGAASPPVVALIVVTVLVSASVQMRKEEHVLANRFGKQWFTYSRSKII